MFDDKSMMYIGQDQDHIEPQTNQDLAARLHGVDHFARQRSNREHKLRLAMDEMLLQFL